MSLQRVFATLLNMRATQFKACKVNVEHIMFGADPGLHQGTEDRGECPGWPHNAARCHRLRYQHHQGMPKYTCVLCKKHSLLQVQLKSCDVQAVLGLSGAVEIATAGVSKYVEAFNNFAFLWQRDLASEYAKFVATHPTREVGLYSLFSLDAILCVAPQSFFNIL